MSKKEKLQFYRALLIALSLSTSNPSIAYAKDNESANQDYPSWFNTLIEYSEKAEEIVNENFVNPLINKTDDLREYNIEDLYIVTDMPNTSPSISRHYYFMSNNTIPVKWTYYYNSRKEKVKQDNNPTYKELRKMYISITNPEVVFRTSEWTNLKTNEVFLDYETWEEDSIIYDENTPAKYIKFTAIEEFLSDADLKRINKTNKLSISDIKRIEEYINNPKYSLDFDNIDILEYKESIKKTKKKN